MELSTSIVRDLHALREKHRHRLVQIEYEIARLENGSDHILNDENILASTVLAVLQGRDALDVGALFTAAIDAGWRSASVHPRNAFASSLARLAVSGRIERVERGLYKLPG